MVFLSIFLVFAYYNDWLVRGLEIITLYLYPYEPANGNLNIVSQVIVIKHLSIYAYINCFNINRVPTIGSQALIVRVNSKNILSMLFSNSL